MVLLRIEVLVSKRLALIQGQIYNSVFARKGRSLNCNAWSSGIMMFVAITLFSTYAAGRSINGWWKRLRLLISKRWWLEHLDSILLLKEELPPGMYYQTTLTGFGSGRISEPYADHSRSELTKSEDVKWSLKNLLKIYTSHFGVSEMVFRITIYLNLTLKAKDNIPVQTELT